VGYLMAFAFAAFFAVHPFFPVFGVKSEMLMATLPLSPVVFAALCYVVYKVESQ
jgi:hypothetical protein